VPGGGDDAQLAATAGKHRPRPEPLAAKPERRVKRVNGRACQRGESRRARRVVRVPVREHDLRDPSIPRPRDVEHPAQVALIVGTRVDHKHGRRTWLGDHPGVRAVKRHRRRVGREHAAGTLGPRAVYHSG
jgi:hypothetical protein